MWLGGKAVLHWLSWGSRAFLVLRISKSFSWIQMSTSSVQKQSGSRTLGQRSTFNPKEASLLPVPQNLLPNAPCR